MRSDRKRGAARFATPRGARLALLSLMLWSVVLLAPGDAAAATPTTVEAKALLVDVTAAGELGRGPHATLRDDNGVPIAGKTIQFHYLNEFGLSSLFGKPFPICTATTDAAGVAGCNAPALYSLVYGAYVAEFPGDADYERSLDSARLVRLFGTDF